MDLISVGKVKLNLNMLTPKIAIETMTSPGKQYYVERMESVVDLLK